ncbi:MAG: transketolase C-terminal domain-containing protein, partial ['Waltheria sp.' little leaf phytoplasma]|nr:transketolase C-terminal domain-containing protein ['Waltheria sp.' little leaf phytoplasma]
VEPYEIEIGKARVVKEGSDVTIVGWSSAIPVILTAIESLVNQSVDGDVPKGVRETQAMDNGSVAGKENVIPEVSDEIEA